MAAAAISIPRLSDAVCGTRAPRYGRGGGGGGHGRPENGISERLLRGDGYTDILFTAAVR